MIIVTQLFAEQGREVFISRLTIIIMDAFNCKCNYFFNQLRFRQIPQMIRALTRGEIPAGVMRGNLTATLTLVLILVIAVIAVLL